jgi:hypothetical protein
MWRVLLIWIEEDEKRRKNDRNNVNTINVV